MLDLYVKAENLRRNVQSKRKADYQEKHGRPMPRDSLFLGSAYRKAGIFTAYDPARPENAQDDERGLGAWQDRKNWQLVSLSLLKALDCLPCLHRLCNACIRLNGRNKE